MKRTVAVVALALVFAGGVAFAQQPPAQPPGPAPGHRHMHGAMCPMMGMMGGGMMGMMGGQSDPRSIQMRGEMMKAMGEIMMKYGKAMETPSR